MVAVQAIGEITDPTAVIQRIYSDDDDDRLPAAVTRHFSALFLSPDALLQLPPLDVSHPPESYMRGTLVRFCAMIQDTSLQSEMYLARFSNNRCGGWGIQPTQGDYELDTFDPDNLGTASVFWAVSVPGETSWHSAEISRSDLTGFPVHCPSQPHKFPVPGAAHIGVRLKIYDNDGVESLHATDVVTFVGIISSESLDTEDDSSPEVPVLHVLCYQMATTKSSPKNFHATVRKDLLDWLSHEALHGDSDVAEWLLLQLTSKVHSCAIPLLPPSLTISRFPPPSSPELLPTLSHVLAELLPRYLPISLSLDLLNKIPFLPESKGEDLHAGYLQLPFGTTILLTESALQEGKLLEKGIGNVRAIQDVMDSQTIEYIFPFSSTFTFHTDLSLIVLSEGRKSALFQTSVNVALRGSSDASSLYKPKDEISLPPAQKLTIYRSYITACTVMSEKVQVTEETSKHIQDDFVRQRQQDKSITSDDLIHLMKVARLLAASRLENEVTIDIWERTKELDGRRRASLV